MDFIINDLPAQPAVYMRRTGEYGTENYQLMERFKKWAGGKGLLKSGVIYGIAWGNVNTTPEKCRYDVCMAVPAKFPPDDEVEF